MIKRQKCSRLAVNLTQIPYGQSREQTVQRGIWFPPRDKENKYKATHRARLKHTPFSKICTRQTTCIQWMQLLYGISINYCSVRQKPLYVFVEQLGNPYWLYRKRPSAIAAIKLTISPHELLTHSVHVPHVCITWTLARRASLVRKKYLQTPVSYFKLKKIMYVWALPDFLNAPRSFKLLVNNQKGTRIFLVLI